MAMSISMCKEALNYYTRGFFKDIHSVMDMGDQDLNVPYGLLAEFVGQTDLKLNEGEFERARHLPERPRVPTSTFWKMMGIEHAERMDINSIERAFLPSFLSISTSTIAPVFLTLRFSYLFI